MAERFNRSARLTLTRTRPGQFFGDSGDNAIVIERLRVTFNVERTLEPEPDKAEIAVYNLGAQTRADLQASRLNVTLDAGYANRLVTVVKGDSRRAQSRRAAPEWVTQVNVGDGARAYRFARLSKSYKRGVSVKGVVGDLAKSMGLRIPTSVADAKELAVNLISGEAVDGPSSANMSRILNSRGLSWSIQNGQLQITRKGETRTAEALIVAPETGLIGSPEYGDPSSEGGPPVLSFTVLLDPQIFPGSLVSLRSQAVAGNFLVKRVVHAGDTHGKDWSTRVEATELGR